MAFLPPLFSASRLPFLITLEASGPTEFSASAFDETRHRFVHVFYLKLSSVFLGFQLRFLFPFAKGSRKAQEVRIVGLFLFFLCLLILLMVPLSFLLLILIGDDASRVQVHRFLRNKGSREFA